MQSYKTLDDFLPGFRPQTIRPRDKRGRQGTGWMVRMAFGGRAGAHNVACESLGAGGYHGQKGYQHRDWSPQSNSCCMFQASMSSRVSTADHVTCERTKRLPRRL